MKRSKKKGRPPAEGTPKVPAKGIPYSAILSVAILVVVLVMAFLQVVDGELTLHRKRKRIHFEGQAAVMVFSAMALTGAGAIFLIVSASRPAKDRKKSKRKN